MLINMMKNWTKHFQENLYADKSVKNANSMKERKLTTLNHRLFCGGDGIPTLTK